MSDLIVSSVDELKPINFEAGGLDAVISKAKEIADEFLEEQDLKTEKGRKEIASNAYKMARLKGRIKEFGKDYREDYQRKAKAVIAEENRAVEAIQELQDKIRKPLSDWEEAEKDRKANHELNLQELKTYGSMAEAQWQTLNVAELKSLQERLVKNVPSEEWEEYQDDALLAFETTLEQIDEALGKRAKYDRDQAELEELRQKQREREEKEDQERIKAEAEAKAKKEAEQKIEQERQAKEAAEKARVEAEERAEREKAEAEQAAKEAAEKAEKEKAEAEERARQDERDRIERERQEKEAEEAKRKADQEHRNSIVADASKCLVNFGLDADKASDLIKAIERGEITNISINF